MGKKKGFTLIEVLVVIVVLGILAAIAVPKLFGNVAKAKSSELPIAASTYMRLQDIAIGMNSAVGNWHTIGYDAPGNNGVSPYFKYTEGEITDDKVSLESLSSGKIGWQATNIVGMDRCTLGQWWTITLTRTEGKSQVDYNAIVSSDKCVSLASNFTAGTKTGVADNVQPEQPKETNLLENTVVAIKGTWDGSGGHGQNSSNYRLSTKNTSDGSDGLFKLEPNSTYTFTISAGEDLAEGELNVGILLYEDSTGKSRAVVDDG